MHPMHPMHPMHDLEASDPLPASLSVGYMGNKRQLGKGRVALVLGFTDDDEIKRLNHNWVIQEAFHQKKITAAQHDGALKYEMKTCKRYLWSVTKDPGVRNALERYVKLFSRVRAAGSKLLNLFLSLIHI